MKKPELKWQVSATKAAVSCQRCHRSHESIGKHWYANTKNRYADLCARCSVAVAEYDAEHYNIGLTAYGEVAVINKEVK